MDSISSIIAAQNLTIGYNPQHSVVQNFTGAIAPGQFVGMFGANGAGKTTFLRCLLGLIKPLGGGLTVLGDKPRQGDTRIGYMPQAVLSPQVNMSGRAILAASIRGHRWGLPLLSKQSAEEIDRIVELVGAQDLVDRSFMQLSGGECRRLLLAQALLGSPPILLLDEPLANLDPHYQYTLVALLSRVHKELGITILLTAHDMNPLLDAMTQVLYLAGGKAVIGDVAGVVNNTVLSDLYGSPIEVFKHHGRIFVMHRNTGQVENVACN